MDTKELLAVLLPFLVGVGLIAIAFVVVRTGWQHRHNRFFAALYFLSGLKSVSEGMLTQVTESSDGVVQMRFVAEIFHAASPLFPDARAWFVVSAVCASFMLPLLLLFVMNFPRPVTWVLRASKAQYLFLVPAPVVAYFVVRAGLDGDVAALKALEFLFNHAGSLVVLVASFVLLRTRAKAEPIERKQATYLLIGMLPSFLITLLITAIGDAALMPQFGARAAEVGDVLQGHLLVYISPILELAAGAFVAYAILKYRILSFELKVKGGVKYALMTVILGVFLFVIEVYVGNFVFQNQIFSFLGPAGSAGLAAVSGIVVFKPVHKLAGAATDKLFPEARQPKATYLDTRSHEIYRAQVTTVLRDGNVTDREWSFLRSLRDQLSIPEREARTIEEEVERLLKVDDPRTGKATVGGGQAGF